MNMNRFLSGLSTRPEQPGQLGPQRQAAASPGFDGQALLPPGVVNRGGDAEPWAILSAGPAVSNAIALRLRRVLADSARAWALAAGVPPDLYN